MKMRNLEMRKMRLFNQEEYNYNHRKRVLSQEMKRVERVLGILEPQEIDIIKFTYMSLNLENFNVDNISFLEQINNRVIEGVFSSILYSDSDVIFNALYIIILTKYPIKKVIQMLISIERSILDRYIMFNKTTKYPIYTIRDYFQDDSTKYFSMSNFLKISGIWETDENFGLNHKFISNSNW